MHQNRDFPFIKKETVAVGQWCYNTVDLPFSQQKPGNRG
ncbi:hypothetical protein FAES_2015 [Fibrella aestuarina BUZ 2]|uniref:Uncharacterized protein n=1 Tax=Fibrella aestuarina BUZ 2 TaxID=1166018 RepID=I0K7C1_9BACT|nr:hypothetical protein FAES_2015 [Fibrella aestuarina BUZ 2]